MSKGEAITLKIEGMSCGHCKMSVEKALQAIAGVVSVNVSLEKKEAIVTGTAEKAAIVAAIENIGFDVV